MNKFRAESQRILELMINSIYTNKEIFLRELISNASDAIDKAHFLSLTDSSYNDDYSIELTVNKALRTLTVKDNGIGMTREELDHNLSTIAASGTGVFKEQNKDALKDKSGESLIGQFGVGFYSAFMVADKIDVISKNGSDSNMWSSDGTGYEIAPYPKLSRGTEVVLHIREKCEDFDFDVFLDEDEISRLVKKYSDYIRYPIEMDILGKREVLNSMVPLWKKGRDATDEELNGFYTKKYYDYLPPLKTVCVNAEGSVSYNALLFIPSKASFDFYTPQYERGLSLYCNGVLIMENCRELLPEHLGFVRGVVDSGDLNLNISREVIQQSRQLRFIAKGIEKKILSTLEGMLKNERDKYVSFFNQFGSSLKLGIYSEFGAKKDELKDLIMFYSSKEKKPITLSEYILGMDSNANVDSNASTNSATNNTNSNASTNSATSALNDNKNNGESNLNNDAILYAAGTDDAAVERLPVYASVCEKGYNVLHLTDRVDEFVVKILGEYNGKPFRSITDSKFSLEGQDTTLQNDDHSPLFKAIEKCLEGKVSKVVASKKLTGRAVCLSSEGEVSLEMERVLTAINKDNKLFAKRVLELNPLHPVFNVLKGLVDKKEKLLAVSQLLFGEALLLSGMEVSDPSGFANSLELIIGMIS